MAETLILDPAPVAVGRTEWDITQYVAEGGPDWGDAAIEQFLADSENGSVPVSYRVPSRTISIPLLLLSSRQGTTYTFEQVRQRFQQKAAMFQREGGWIKRTTSIGTVYADITGATLKFGGSTAQALWGIDADAVLTLTCLPDWYMDEVSTPVKIGTDTTGANTIQLGGNHDSLALALPPGPELFWSLAAGGGGNIDQSGHGRNGGGFGGITVGGFASGPFLNSTSTDFDGVDDTLTSSYQPFINGSKLSIAGWAMRDTAGAINTLFSSANLVAGTWVRCWLDASNNVWITFNGGTTPYQLNLSSSNTWPGIGVWVHWAFVWDSTKSRGFFYVNGNRGAEAPLPINGYQSSPGPLDFGSRGATADWFDGKMRSVSVFSRLLSESEVRALYNNGVATGYVAGSYPARVRAIVTDTSGLAKNGLMYAVRSRNYSPLPTAQMEYRASLLTPLDLAYLADPTNIEHDNLTMQWTSVLSTDMPLNGPMTHVGNYRVWAEIHNDFGTSTPPKLRLVWDVGDLVAPVQNAAVQTPSLVGDYVVDLGVVRLPKMAVGAQRWRGVIQAVAMSDTARGIMISRVWFQCFDEYAGVLTTPFNADPALRGYTAVDEFRQANGNLNGVTAGEGGAWATSGDATDLAISSGVLVRSVATDTATGGRLALMPTIMTDMAVMCDIKVSALGACRAGLVARFPAGGTVAAGAFSDAYLDIANNRVAAGGGAYSAPFTFAVNTFYTLQQVVTSSGRVIIWCWPTGTPKGDPLFSYSSSAYLTGQTMASGKAGILDYSTAAITRTYDNFFVWVPDVDATLYASRRAELRTGGMFRESIDGTYFGPVSKVVGDLPRLPVAGLEQRSTEVMVLSSNGDFDQAPHYSGMTNGIPTNLQLVYRPCHLFVP
jgi:Concanavalin A-like lectin/glucanases superfamily